MPQNINYTALALIAAGYFALIGVAILGRVEPLQQPVFG